MNAGIVTRRTVAVVALGLSAGTASGCAPRISTQQEVQLGTEYARQLNSQLPIVTDPTVSNYVNSLGNQIARRVDQRGLQYTFYLVNASAVNAFAVPGGYIYINRGLVDRADNVSELAGVLAHEIGHVVERHSVEQIQRAQGLNTGVGLGAALYGVLTGRNPGQIAGAAVQVGGGAYLANHSREAEREADERAVQYTVQTGFNPQGLVTFLAKLLAEQRRNPSAVERWFATHPTTQERIDLTQRSVAALPAGSANLISNTAGFNSFKARVAQLPAPPPPRQRRR